MKPSSKQTQSHPESSSTQAHSFQGSVHVVIDGIIYRQQKMVMLRKQQSVCYNLTCNSSRGLSGKAWGTERCVSESVPARWSMRVCVWANALGWEGETANRTSGLVTALINLPPGHKSPALLSPLSQQPPSLKNREPVAASFRSKSPSEPQWKYRTRL